MKFLRHLLGITKLDKEKNNCIREKTGIQNIVKEIKQYQEKWLQNVQRIDTNRIPKQALKYKPKDERTQDDREEMEGPISFWGYKEQETHLILHEHDDDDDDDDDDEQRKCRISHIFSTSEYECIRKNKILITF